MFSLREKYNKEVVQKMKKQFGFKNDLAVPRISKVVINAGVGKFLKDSNMLEDIYKSLAQITGQRPATTEARKSIAGFKIRQGLKVGVKVTLRGRRMWDFVEKLVGMALPRIRDFRGLKETNVDDGGNLNIGIKEHLVFPEIFPEQVKNIFSLQITLVTNAGKIKGLELFRLLGFPMEPK